MEFWRVRLLLFKAETRGGILQWLTMQVLMLEFLLDHRWWCWNTWNTVTASLLELLIVLVWISLMYFLKSEHGFSSILVLSLENDPESPKQYWQNLNPSTRHQRLLRSATFQSATLSRHENEWLEVNVHFWNEWHAPTIWQMHYLPFAFVKTKCWTQLGGRNSRWTDGFLLVSWAFCPRATSIWIASRVPGEWSWLKAIGIPEPKHVTILVVGLHPSYSYNQLDPFVELA